MVIDATQHPLNFCSEQITQWANRHTGVGFDQLLMLETSSVPGVDFLYRIFNANGQEVGQCGNGARCLAKFIQARGLSTKQELCIQTLNTTMQLLLQDDDSVTVAFPQPNLAPHLIPIQTSEEKTLYSLRVGHNHYHFHVINVGNPHAVLVSQHWTDVDIPHIGLQ
jgi:diaminopimelate epimerase